MKKVLFVGALLISISTFAKPDASPADLKFYRDMILKLRGSAEFKVPMPANGDMHFNYKLEFGNPKWKDPITTEYSMTGDDLKPNGKFIRYFWDKIFLKDGSYIEVGGEQVPITCIHVDAQDNRFSGKNGPLLPDFIIKVTIVANDWTCTGPINPGWPANGGRKESWDTYIHYAVKDPTIMLPVDAALRYRWSEFQAVLVK